MGKKLLLLVLTLCLLTPAALAGGDEIPSVLFMHPGEVMAAPQADAWESSAEQIATVDADGYIAAHSEGPCQISCTTDGVAIVYPLTVDIDVPTELMKKTIAAAENEFVTLDGKGVKRANKYTKWYAGKSGVEFGWCGAFVGWCLEEAGVPMYRVEKAQKVADDATFAISEASVGKILKGYQKMERTTDIPRPGYLVIYSVTKKSYYNIHVGLVTEVSDLGDGKYLLTTIEGNVSSRVKKYKYYYDSSQEAAEKQRNMSALPEEMQTDEKVCYTLHSKDWYIKIFCQTYI